MAIMTKEEFKKYEKDPRWKQATKFCLLGRFAEAQRLVTLIRKDNGLKTD